MIPVHEGVEHTDTVFFIVWIRGCYQLEQVPFFKTRSVPVILYEEETRSYVA